MQNQISSGDDEKSQNICYVQKKNQSTPQRFETHAIAERAVRREKEGTSSVLVHSGLQETGGQKPWNGTAISDTCKSFWQTAKRLMNDGSLHHFDGPIISFGAEVTFLSNIITRPRSSVWVWYKNLFWKFHWMRLERGWKLDWWYFDRGCRGAADNSTIWKSCKKIQNKRSGHSQQKRWTCIPVQNVRNLARRTAAIYRYLQCGAATHAGILAKLFRRKRSPRSSSKSRCRSSTRFLKHHGKLHVSEHVAPRTQLYVPKKDFPRPLNYWFSEANKNEHWCISRGCCRWFMEYWWRQDIVWTLDQCDKIRIDQQRSTRRTHVGSRPIDQATSYCKTWIHLARRTVKHFEKKNSQRKAVSKRAEGNPKMDAARERRGKVASFQTMTLITKRSWTPWGKELEIRRASAMLCKVSSLANPNGSC